MHTPNAAFPRLTSTNHRITSPPDDRYNCIAWAVGETRNWWQPGAWWPIPADSKDGSVGTLIAALSAVGFELCPDGSTEQGVEKIIGYSNGAGYTHAARQLPSGKWTSKLGELEDIEHDSPDDVAGGLYGAVVQFLKRPSPPLS
jgi:hypothetical protein